MIRKILALSSVILTLSVVPVYAAMPQADEVTLQTESNVLQENERKIDFSTNISISVNDTWKKRFDTDRLFFADHNAFKVNISNVSGSFKYIILGGNGYYYESSELKNQSVTFITTNAKPDVKYTISIINTSSSKKLTADVSVKSYKE